LKIVFGWIIAALGVPVALAGVILWFLNPVPGGRDGLGQPLDADLYRDVGGFAYDIISMASGLAGLPFIALAALGVFLLYLGREMASSAMKLRKKGSTPVMRSKCVPCQKLYEFPSEAFGTKAQCPKCRGTLEALS
jgi:hypothetical protein